MTDQEQKHFDNLIGAVNGIKYIKNVIVKSGKFELAASARDLEKQLHKELSDFFGPDVSKNSIKELQKCYLPFYGLHDLYNKCKEIVSALSDYQKSSVEILKELGVEYSEMGGYGLMINVDQPNHEKFMEYVGSSKNNWKLFIDTFVEKYEIKDPNNTIKI